MTHKSKAYFIRFTDIDMYQHDNLGDTISSTRIRGIL